MGKERDGDYEGHRERMAEVSRARSEEGRDIKSIPKIKNIKRRESCRFDLRLFCETYNPKAFFWDWSEAHLRAIARLEESILHGAMYAFAMPRGSGKSTLCRMAALWAVSYAHSRFVFVIGATAPKAEKNLKAIKAFIGLQRYVEDFPEVAVPVRRLGNIANRASGQTFDGEPTDIAWGKDGITLPTVPPPPNWPKGWGLREDGKAPTSGATIAVSGLTGDGIRGTLETSTTGEQIRPDAVLLDDPQSDESAASLTQNAEREALITDAVLGMAGPEGRLSAFMPCTVIRPGDMVDRILDRKLHPEWRGERTKLLASMPTNMDAWEEYFEVYRACHLKEPPDFSEANSKYQAERATLEAGAVATWPARKRKGDVSAIQHAMHLYCDRGKAAFFAGYQNEPVPTDIEKAEVVTAEFVARKTNGLKRGAAPVEADILTAFIDVQMAALYWGVCGWEKQTFTGWVLDYNAWPDQKRSYYTLLDIRNTLAMATGAKSLEAAIYQGLEALTAEILGREWTRPDGARLRIQRCLIDANWGQSTDTVYQFCRQSIHAAILTPSHGKYVGGSSQPFSDYKRKVGERVGWNWRMPNVKGTRAVRHVLFDSNAYKTFVYARWAVPMGGAGCLSIFGDRPDQHRLFADHQVAEYRVPVTGRGRQVDEWKLRPAKPDNHFLDVVAGNAVAASVEGVELAETRVARQERVAHRTAASPDDAARKRAEFQRNRGF
jgi:hypothetical protein